MGKDEDGGRRWAHGGGVAGFAVVEGGERRRGEVGRVEGECLGRGVCGEVGRDGWGGSGWR